MQQGKVRLGGSENYPFKLELIVSGETKKVPNIKAETDMSIGVLNNPKLFDESYPPDEQLPRVFTAEFIDETSDSGFQRTRMLIDGEQVGDELGDNSYEADGYRFHDIIHLAHAAVLGWSPLLRRLLGRKRKSDPLVDEVEDGGRAIMLEESVSAITFEYAKRNEYLEGIDKVDPEVIDLIRRLTGDLEVNIRSAEEWEAAILNGLRVWRTINSESGGLVRADLTNRTLEVVA